MAKKAIIEFKSGYRVHQASDVYPSFCSSFQGSLPYFPSLYCLVRDLLNILLDDDYFYKCKFVWSSQKFIVLEIFQFAGFDRRATRKFNVRTKQTPCKHSLPFSKRKVSFFLLGNFEIIWLYLFYLRQSWFANNSSYDVIAFDLIEFRTFMLENFYARLRFISQSVEMHSSKIQVFSLIKNSMSALTMKSNKILFICDFLSISSSFSKRFKSCQQINDLWWIEKWLF